MKDHDLKIETHGNYSPGIVNGDLQITQTIINQYKDSKNKRWRNLGTLFRPVIEDNYESRGMFKAHLVIHLHRIFKSSGYINFTSLFCLGTSTFEDKTFPGYLLITHQTKYIGALRESWKYIWNSSIELNIRKEYQDVLNNELKELMTNWSLDINIDFTEDLCALEFTYNPDEHKISIKRPSIISDDPVDYPEKVRTTSEFLTFFSTVIYAQISCWQDLHCITSYYPLTKFCIRVIDNECVSPENIRINVDDCEEYDYINTEFDAEVKKYSID